MSEDLEKIKQLVNSRNNLNFYMAWNMLRQYKKYERGEFRDLVKELFFVKGRSKNTFNYEFLLEKVITIRLHKYTFEGESVFSTKIYLQGIKTNKKKKIPIEFFEGQTKHLLNRAIVYLDNLTERI